MPSLTLLQLRLDELSPQFPDRLISLLHGQEYRDYVTSLQDKDLPRLVEYLDDVSPRVAFTNSLLKLPKVLDALHPASPAFREVHRELREICGSRKILPQSSMLPASLLNIAERPVASKGFCDVYEGLLNDSKVCVKRLRIHSVEGPTDVKRVCCRGYCIHAHI